MGDIMMVPSSLNITCIETHITTTDIMRKTTQEEAEEDGETIGKDEVGRTIEKEEVGETQDKVEGGEGGPEVGGEEERIHTLISLPVQIHPRLLLLRVHM